MKATLEFNLPTDNTEHIVAVHSMDWALVVYDLDQQLRDIIKYGKEGYNSMQAEKIREDLHEIMDERSVSLGIIT